MPMTNKEFGRVLGKLGLVAGDILAAKGPEYAGHGGDNRLANFETIEVLLRGAPVDALTVAAVYWLKHVLAICTYIRTRKEGVESLESRFADESNYNALLWACVKSLEGGGEV